MLVRRAGRLAGPAEVLLLLEYLGRESVATGQRYAAEASMLAATGATGLDAPGIQRSLVEMSRALAGPFESREMRVVGRALRRFAEAAASPPHLPPSAATLASKAAEAAQELEDLILREQRPPTVNNLAARTLLLNSAAEYHRMDRRGDLGRHTELTVPTPAERRIRGRLLELAPVLLAQKLADPRYRNYLAAARDQLGWSCLLLADDEAASRATRIAALDAATQIGRFAPSLEYSAYLRRLAAAFAGPERMR